MNNKHFQEMLAMFLVGDGIVLAVDPERHLKLWDGVDPIPGVVALLERHPMMSRVIGIAAAVGGLLWASRLRPTTPVLNRVSESPT